MPRPTKRMTANTMAQLSRKQKSMVRNVMSKGYKVNDFQVYKRKSMGSKATKLSVKSPIAKKRVRNTRTDKGGSFIERILEE